MLPRADLFSGEYRPIGLVFTLHPDTKSYIRYNVSLRSKRFRLVSEQRKTEERDLGFGRARNEIRSQKLKVGGGGGEGRKRLQTNPSILKTCVRQRTQRLIGSAFRTALTCVDQRFVSY